jgi:dihydrofolate reductase
MNRPRYYYSDMPKVILFIATSLDGYIAGPAGEIDWLFHDADYGYTPFFDSVEALVMGRKTYELSLSFGEWPYGDKPAYVFTRRTPPDDPRVRFVAGDATGLIAGLRASGRKNIWLVGGAALVSTFLQEGLIDEFVISVHPLLLGAGIPLFAPGVPRRGLRLVSVTPFASGLIQLHYTSEPDPDCTGSQR